MTQTLQTPRLTLRAPRTQDAQSIVAGLNDLDVSRWLIPVPFPYTMADAHEFIADHAHRGESFLIWQGDRLVGCVGAGARLGYWIAREFWGRGLASEAAAAVVARYFSQWHDALYSGYLQDNARSRRVLAKLGFHGMSRGETTRAVTSRARGRAHVLHRMILTRSAWEARTT